MSSLENREEQAPGGEHGSKNRFKEPEGTCCPPLLQQSKQCGWPGHGQTSVTDEAAYALVHEDLKDTQTSNEESFLLNKCSWENGLLGGKSRLTLTVDNLL